jgi:uncharacterized membrane protein
MRRLDSVDVLRAMALVSMLICHYPIYLSSGAGNDAMLYFFANHLLGGDFAASWFVFLVGLSQVLSARKRATDENSNISRVIVRGGAIFIIGLLFLLIIQGYQELWAWDILTFIGATTIILLICRKATSWVLLLGCLTVFFIAPWLRSLIDIASFYGGGFESVRWISDIIPNYFFDPVKDYEGGMTVLDNVIGFFLIGQFPLFPWIIFPVIGFVIGRRITQNHLAADAPFVLVIGLMFMFMGLLTAYAGSIRPTISVANDYVAPLSFYPVSFSMIMLVIGVALTLFIFLWHVFDANPDATKKSGVFLTYCRQISKYSLTIYISHFALIFLPLRIIQAITGTYYLKNLMSTPVAFTLAVFLLVLYYPVLKLWDKGGGKYSFEWFLAKLLSP